MDFWLVFFFLSPLVKKEKKCKEMNVLFRHVDMVDLVLKWKALTKRATLLGEDTIERVMFLYLHRSCEKEKKCKEMNVLFRHVDLFKALKELHRYEKTRLNG